MKQIRQNASGYQYLAPLHPPTPAPSGRPVGVFFHRSSAPPSSPSPLSPLPLSGLFLSPFATHEPVNADVLPCRAGQNRLFKQTGRGRLETRWQQGDKVRRKGRRVWWGESQCSVKIRYRGKRNMYCDGNVNWASKSHTFIYMMVVSFKLLSDIVFCCKRC